MKFKPTAAWLPLVLLSLSGAARADIEPFTIGASETVNHDNNIYHTAGGKQSDWYSTTDVHGGVDQTLGRDRLTANLAANYTNYSKLDQRDAFGYHGDLNLDWSTIGDLSGALGASSDRHAYIYGINDETQSTSSRNLETTNHAYARATLGGLARWSIFGGVNAMERKYSDSSFNTNAERQVTSNFGTNYSTSPDLTFGVVGNYTRGEYPHYVDQAGNPSKETFTSRSLSATTRLQATGNSAFNAALGYTTEESDLQPRSKFMSGNLNWSWTPPSHFKVQAGLSRSSSGGVGSGAVDTLNDRSINTSGNLDLTYSLTAKISLAADASYIQRKYSGVVIPVIVDDVVTTETISGSNHSTSFGLSVHYQPTRITDLNCGGTRETRSSNAALASVIPGYTDTTYRCAASINFN